MIWSFQSRLERVEELERMIRVLEKSINSKKWKHSDRHRKDDYERLSTLRHELTKLKENTQESEMELRP